MQILKDERAQGSAELILVFGGVIVIAMVAAFWYKEYLIGAGKEVNSTDVQNVTNQLNQIKDKF